MPVFLVTAATGRQGGSVANLLLEAGATVHALVRNCSSPAATALETRGTVLYEGGFDDATSIGVALQGVSGIFLNLWPTADPEEQINQARAIIQLAETAGVSTIVVSTAFLANSPEIRAPLETFAGYYAGKAGVEDVVRKSSIKNYTILRPAVLMHNFFRPDAQYHYPELATQGTLAHVLDPGRCLPYLDAADVGKFAADALLNPEKYNKHEIELGFQNLGAEEVAAAIGKASGRMIKVHRRTQEEIDAIGQSVPTLSFQALANEVDLTIDGQALQAKYGLRLRTLEEFLGGEKDNLFKSLPTS